MGEPEVAETQREPQPEPQPEPQDGSFILTVRPDGMSATLSVTPPLYGGAPVTLEQVTAGLKECHVTFGIDLEAIRRLTEAASGNAQGPVDGVIARGELPVHGEDGRILPHELLQTPSGYPCVRDDGTVDFFTLNMVRNVGAGITLATRQPPVRGKAGTDVLGRSLPARDGREARLRAGRGTKLSADGQSVHSAIEGHAAITEQGEVSVSPVFTVKGDVDFSTGNIDFVGTVVVLGDIGPGFFVKAVQNVEVHGGIMGGSVEAGGDVIVRYGIVGAGRSRVTAGGKVQCRFVEGAEISTAGDVVVAESVLNAHISAGGKMTATGSRGCIIGGRVCATREVSARVIGSNLGTATEIKVGLAPEVRAELERLQQSLQGLEEQLQRSTQNIGFLREREAEKRMSITPQQKVALQQAVRMKHKVRSEQEALRSRQAALEAQTDQVASAKIRALEVAYPGVRIAVGHERYAVLDLSQNCCFFLSKEGEVTLGPA